MLATTNGAISLGVSTLIVIALIIVIGFGVYLTSTFNTTSTTSAGPTSISNSSSSSINSQVTSTTNFTPLLNGICLDEMPANASITNFQNSSFIGYEVSMTNGTTSYLPARRLSFPSFSEAVRSRRRNRGKLELHRSREELHVCC